MQIIEKITESSSTPCMSGFEEKATLDTIHTEFKLGCASIDEDRPFKVIVIGAGFSGIFAGIKFPQIMKNLDLTIYEKNDGVGGTWYSNRYPGAACDHPSHCYQYSFEEKTDWSAFYSPGPEILADLKRVVDKYKLMRFIQLRHELIHANYDEKAGKWHLKLRRQILESQESEIVEDSADFILLCIGSLSRWKWPDIDGLDTFKGQLVHSAEWLSREGTPWEDTVSDWNNKRVGVIGAGSTATQIVPSIQPYVKKLYNYLLSRESTESNYTFTTEDKKLLADPEFFKCFRHELEDGFNSMHYLTIKGSKFQEEARAAFTDHMASRLKKKPWIMQYLKPDFSVGCRRLTPGPGYLETLQEENVELVTTRIAKITQAGVVLDDGSYNELDVIVCTTGFDTSFQYPFEVVGRGGRTLRERYNPYPETYLSLCTDGFPNLFATFGPNSAFGTGSFIPVLEAQVQYIIKAAKKLQREHLKSIEPRPEAVADFNEFLEAYMKTTVFDEHCRSWYKIGKADGHNTGLWPGSCLHAIKTYKEPRWEDFHYEQLSDSNSKNRFYWLGDGSTYNEKYMVGDRAWYLDPMKVDIPAAP